MVNITIEAVGFRKITARYNFVHARAPAIAKEEVHRLAQKLAESVREELGGEGIDPFGFTYKESLIRSVAVADVGTNESDVIQSGDGKWILRGTKPVPNAKTAPEKLVDWVQFKTGLDRPDAYGAAIAIRRKGTLGRSRAHWPPGSPGFDYPAYIVEIKERDAIMQAAVNAGNLIVQYLGEQSPLRSQSK